MPELLTAATDLGPDVDAFMGGVKLGLAAVFILLVLFGGLSIFRRIVGS